MGKRTRKRTAKVTVVDLQADFAAVAEQAENANAAVFEVEPADSPHLVLVSHEPFNRAGFDALMENITGTGITKVVEVEKPKRIFKKGTLLPLAEEMLRDGATGAEVIQAIKDEYTRRGCSRGDEYMTNRGKTILQHALRELRKEEKAAVVNA